MKTKEELAAIKAEVEALNEKLAELNEEELSTVAGGIIPYLAAGAPMAPGALGGGQRQRKDLLGSDKASEKILR